MLTFPAGILEPHYKKLLLCDSRLRALAAGLPEPVAMRPPAYQKLQLQVPRVSARLVPVRTSSCIPASCLVQTRGFYSHVAALSLTACSKVFTPWTWAFHQADVLGPSVSLGKKVGMRVAHNYTSPSMF